MALKESWDRDLELRRLLEKKQRDMLERAGRWRADMTRQMTRNYGETGRVDFDAASTIGATGR